MTIYDINIMNAQGEQTTLNPYKGKVLLIVNTATGCGFTPQYEGLQKLYERYANQGFEVLDFPCNQFNNQASGSDEQISEFCKLNYGTTFPRFAKIEVNGANTSPLFAHLKKQKSGLFGKNIKWNFTKFLVDQSGKVVKRFAPTFTPSQIEAHIIALLSQQP